MKPRNATTTAPRNATVSCRPYRQVLVIEKINRAGLSARLWRLVEAMQVALAMGAVVVVPTPCKCLGGHGKPSCHGNLAWWDGYVDTAAFESRLAPDWSPVCGGLLRQRDPWKDAEHRPLASKDGKHALGAEVKVAFSERQERTVWTLKNHKTLPVLARVKPVRGKPLTQHMLHAGDFPVSRSLDAVAEDIVARYLLRRPFYAVKVRRTDKLDRGFENCTEATHVADAVAMNMPQTAEAVFVMSDEPDKSSWWPTIQQALHDRLDSTLVVTEVDAIHHHNATQDLDNYAVYVVGLAVLKRALAVLTTQNHGETGKHRPTFLCEGLYSYHHGPKHSSSSSSSSDDEKKNEELIFMLGGESTLTII